MANPRPRRALDDHQVDPHPTQVPGTARDTTPQPARPRRAVDEPTTASFELSAFKLPVPHSMRLAVPVVALSALLAGAALVAWPQSEAVTAGPVVNASPATQANSLRDAQADRTNRDTVRPALTPSASAAAQAAEAAIDHAAAAQSAAEKAASDQAAADKAAAVKAEAATKQAVEELDVTGTRYATTALNLRTQASAKADVTKTVPSGTKLSITDTVDDGFRLVSVDDKARWVSNEYLSKDKPKVSAEFSMAPCAEGSAMESGLTKDAIRVHRAVCAKFPQVSSYGGTRIADGGFHSSGRAVDAMISNSDVGWEIARWVRANARALGVSEVIYSQKIWTVQRSGEGWRGMSDRGSATANHYDHVHVSVYGNAGTS